ncbi:MAG: endonuclease MutS2 [Clostridiales bacterium]|nr:endonuclease MutS2 [Clostridiales bacterium]
MNEKYIKVLEYYKILERLKEFAVSDMGKERAMNLRPVNEEREVRLLQAQTEEAMSVIAYAGGNPMSSFTDVREYLRLSTIGATLSMKALLAVADALRACRAVRRALVTDREDTPNLNDLGSRIATNRMLEEDITNAIISEEEMADRASPELYDIRRHVRMLNDKVRDRLNSFIRSASTQKYLMDSIITMRNGRYVIPVRAEHRQQVPGLVHDQSGTGSTLFIEPMAVVEMGNELKEWSMKERQEIERILKEFSLRLAPDAPLVAKSLDIMAEIDVIFAKAYLSREMKAVEPKLNTKGKINLIRARHPLIDPEKVVPSNLWMGEDFTTLVVTGPNTGGKTVTLKTVGLLTLMAQSGMQIPAQFGSELSIFEEVYADIGDEQSIEQSLSTFSSHMTNIVSILDTVTPRSLVLFDELGAGTDPTEGAALAMAILEHLLNMKVTTLATTHYSELKAFALGTKGVENASVEFDVETLRPTYRLSIGVPGKSNAFEISRKLGLPNHLIDAANERLTRDQIRFEDVIANAEYHRQIAEKERKLAEDAHLETQKMRSEAEKVRKEVENQREVMMKKAKEDAKKVLQKAQREAETIISELKKAKAGVTIKEHELHGMRARLQGGIDDMTDTINLKEDDDGETIKNIKVGDKALLSHIGTVGTILSLPDSKGEVMVQAGAMKMKVPVKVLRKAPEEPKKKTKGGGSKVSVAPRQAQMECDVRGMTVEEALVQVDLFIDGACLNSLKQISVIHGKGTGALRSGIHSHLKRHPSVSEFRLGRYGEGEDGVTILTLK